MGQAVTSIFQGIDTSNPSAFTSCTLLAVIQNVIMLMWEASLILGVVYTIYGGFLILTAGGNEDKVHQGRGAITAAVIGIAISLGAWLLVNELIQFLAGNPTFTPWSKLSC